jgi:hypothetical protein
MVIIHGKRTNYLVVNFIKYAPYRKSFNIVSLQTLRGLLYVLYISSERETIFKYFDVI